MYNQEFMMWLEDLNSPVIDFKESKRISNDATIKLIVKVDLGDALERFVQADLVVTHNEYSEWALFRFTPIKNIKGFVIGNLYSSFGEILDLSIQSRGVIAKMIDDKIVPASKRSGVETKLVSISVENFMSDIVKFIWGLSGTDKPLNTTAIDSWKSMNRNDPKIEDFCDGIKLLAKTLEQLGEFGGTVKYKNAKDFLQAVSDRYKAKMELINVNSKFDKAQSPMAILAVSKIKNLVTEYIQLVNKELNK